VTGQAILHYGCSEVTGRFLIKFLFSVALLDIENFTKLSAAIRNHDDYEKFVDQYRAPLFIHE